MHQNNSCVVITRGTVPPHTPVAESYKTGATDIQKYKEEKQDSH
jgi:hypothetical protein